jgi:acyl carrier protein phosphodiesterase
MNFLAHIYLSGNHEKILVGNFMGDYVKGRNYINYPEEVKKGILLHRNIDYFTDVHPVTKLSKSHVAEYYGKYAGIVIDIFYDYLLASDWDKYCEVPLPQYVDNVFDLLKKYYDVLPQGIKIWFPNFIRNNWLIAYSTIPGIEMVLHRMSSRTSLPDFTDFAIKVLREKHEIFKEEFSQFFPSIKDYILNEHGITTGCPHGFMVE